MAGLTPKEKLVMKLWDDGVSMQQIAMRLSTKVKTISRIVTYYDSATEQRDDRAAIAHSTARLRDAILAARGAAA